MKVTIKSAIKTSPSNFECFEDQQFIFQASNTLCIRELGKPESEFINLHKNIEKLYSFRAMSNKKGVFTA